MNGDDKIKCQEALAEAVTLIGKEINEIGEYYDGPKKLSDYDAGREDGLKFAMEQIMNAKRRLGI